LNDTEYKFDATQPAGERKKEKGKKQANARAKRGVALFREAVCRVVSLRERVFPIPR
jgi:hypothetical protein